MVKRKDPRVSPVLRWTVPAASGETPEVKEAAKHAPLQIDADSERRGERERKERKTVEKDREERDERERRGEKSGRERGRERERERGEGEKGEEKREGEAGVERDGERDRERENSRVRYEKPDIWSATPGFSLPTLPQRPQTVRLAGLPPTA